MTAIIVLIIALFAAGLVGWLWQRRQGRAVVSSSGANDSLLAAVGIGPDGFGPTVLHFSADWCGPCATVRRVVAGVVAAPERDLELDYDANSALADSLGVMSLPTTFVFDRRGVERFRIPGIPKPAELRRALDRAASPDLDARGG
jgi:thiol-disulfide isomerase/thioredoxin